MNAIPNIDRYFEPLVGQCPKRAHLGHGSFLVFDFGQRSLQNHKVQYEYHLWIQHVNWRLLRNGQEVANSESRRQIIQLAVRGLESKALERVRHEVRDRKTEFAFSGNISLICKGYSDSREDEYCWSLYMPGMHVLLADAAGQLREVRSDVAQHIPAATTL